MPVITSVSGASEPKEPEVISTNEPEVIGVNEPEVIGAKEPEVSFISGPNDPLAMDNVVVPNMTMEHDDIAVSDDDFEGETITGDYQEVITAD